MRSRAMLSMVSVMARVDRETQNRSTATYANKTIQNEKTDKLEVDCSNIDCVIFTNIGEYARVNKPLDQIESDTLRIGFFLGGMSGPGSGAHARMISLVRALATEEVEIFVYGSSTQLIGLSSALNVHLRSLREPSILTRYLTTRRKAHRFVERDKLDFLQFESLPFPRSLRCKPLFSIHHLTPTKELTFPLHFKELKQFVRNRAIKMAARRAHRVVTLTEWSKFDIGSRLDIQNDHIVAVPFGLEPHSQMHSTTEDVSSKFAYGRYVLALGHLEERKNLITIVQAAAQPEWPKDVSLVLCGGDQGEKKHLEIAAKELGITVAFTGVVDDSTKWHLLQRALCVVMPSTLEGFGIPVLESISMGTPVLVSDRTALPEVVGVAEAVVAAYDAYAWAVTVRQISTVGEARSKLIAKQQLQLHRYNDENVCSSYLKMLESLAKNEK